jgi:hypothetical protein
MVERRTSPKKTRHQFDVVRKIGNEGFKAMLFHLTTEDYIRAIDEQGPAEAEAGGSILASE